MRVAVIGGGIAGLAAAYELERGRQAGAAVEWTLFEGGERFGGVLQTVRRSTPEGDWVMEGGPDSWVAEKPWARELAEELGLGGEVIACKEADKKTYLWQDGVGLDGGSGDAGLVAMPGRMRLMVPEDLRTLQGSPLFSAKAIAAYQQEPERAEELRRTAPAGDETVASFVRRHFGEEVLEKIAAPLLWGVFGGDVERLSVRATMPVFVRMEAEHGSLVEALEALAGRRRAGAGQEGGRNGVQPTFLSLRAGMGSLAEALAGCLPRERCRTGVFVDSKHRAAGGWALTLRHAGETAGSRVEADEVLVALPTGATRRLLEPVDAAAAALIPAEASSAVLVGLGWRPEAARGLQVPPGFGFLVPVWRGGEAKEDRPRMLATTFVDQKFPDRVPNGGRLMRVFFSGELAERLALEPDAKAVGAAVRELGKVLGPVPEPDRELTTVHRWPHSLPQYFVGHGERMEALAERLKALDGLHLLGNGYDGVGVPDLVREARAAARRVCARA